MCLYVERVNELEKALDGLVDDWKDELDPRVPDKDAWIPEEEAEEFRKIMEQAKRERRHNIYRIFNKEKSIHC
ncbi:hypothetical protein LOAG_08528 [Loa loa]|uniref:Uncharacterized protein n=1 Tax=Loa loa TaxID=7209 RepID=A0A1S0TTM8_LOALO|nr:hypothetical protein LOAG_08528 [Loa loa]EFO19962.1 hypothetical protein LOAG_08528 [Loa loa]